MFKVCPNQLCVTVGAAIAVDAFSFSDGLKRAWSGKRPLPARFALTFVIWDFALAFLSGYGLSQACEWFPVLGLGGVIALGVSSLSQGENALAKQHMPDSSSL